MLFEIVKRTPSWVFVLFLVLLVLGYLQSRAGAVSRGKIAILPVTMIGLSFYGLVSAFGVAPLDLAVWLSGVAIAVVIGVKIGAPHGVSYSADTEIFHVPGSWFPLVLMMVIFFIKYSVGVVLARQLPIASEFVFVVPVSFLYGLFSGLFLARAAVIWKTAERADKCT